MNPIEPYLNFPGNAKEAMAFYTKALSGKVLFSQTFGESPMGSQTPDDYKDKIMHATIQAGNVKFMLSDGPPGWQCKPGNNVNLSLHSESIEEIENAFNGLSEGGNVLMPLQETFWAERFGMVIDKFGIGWMTNVEKKKP
jgi:PhnB protein